MLSYEPRGPDVSSWNPAGSGVWRYRFAMPPVSGDPVTLGEGGTPLVALPHAAAWAGVGTVRAKMESQNPTGSFKDRGMTVAVSIARDFGAKLLLCASTGNTSASLAAYASRAGIPCAVIVPRGRIAKGKLSQAVGFGARVLEVDGSFDRALAEAEQLAKEEGRVLLNSLNPYRLEGQKTIVFEIAESTAPSPPQVLCYPYGNGGNVSAAGRGLEELVSRNVLAKSQVPRLLACEAADRGKTFASAIRIERAVNEPKAARALEWTGGHRVAVTDDEIREAQKFLAQREGVLVEPASAASLAGLRRAVRGGSIASSADAVLVLTGSGLKDPDSATELGSSPQVVEASRDALSHALARPLGIFTPAGPAEARAGAIG